MDTVIEMDVAEPHISINKLGESEKDSVVFTITNNGEKKASYSVKQTSVNDESIQIVASAESLELEVGETGEIEVSFKAGEQSKKGELYNFTVVKDNGWKREYRRVIEVDISNAFAKEDVSGNMLFPIIVGGIAILLAAGIVTTVIIKKKKNKKEV